MLNCLKCNSELEEGAMFCPDCGCKVKNEIYCTKCGEKTSSEFAFCESCGMQMDETVAIETPIEAVKITSTNKITPAKKANIVNKKVIAVTVGIIAVAAAAFVLITNMQPTSTNEPFMYIKDNEVNYTSLSKIVPLELTSGFSASAGNEVSIDHYMSTHVSALFYYSADGRYLFYPDMLDYSSASYYFKDMKSNNPKTNTPVKIDSEISLTSMDAKLSKTEDKFFYIKGNDNRLYVYDMKTNEKVKIDSDVQNFYINDNGSYIVYATDEGSIYEMDIKTGSQKNKIDSGSEIQSVSMADNSLFYVKEDSLYYKKKDAAKAKIAANVSRVISVINDKEVYYIKSEDISYALSDYIDDDYSESDSIMIEPTYPEYVDFEFEIWVADRYGSTYNEETKEYGYWNTKTDQEKYNIAYDKYYEDYDLYVAKVNRDKTREKISESKFELSKDTLIYFNGTESTKVADNIGEILASSNKYAIIAYNKYDNSEIGKIKLSDISYVDTTLSEIIEAQTNAVDSFVSYKSNESTFEHTNGHSFRINNESGAIYYIDDYDEEKRYGTLMQMSFDKENISKPIKIDDDVNKYRFGNESATVFYFKDVKDETGDLCLNGEILASDVYSNSMYSFKGNNNLLFYKDYSVNNVNGTLTMLKNGIETKISDDVSYFTVESENSIVYLIDYSDDRYRGDAVLYNGSNKPVSIDTDVSSLLWKKVLIDNSFGG